MAWIEVNGGQRNLAFELTTANHLRITLQLFTEVVIYRAGETAR